MTKISNKNGSYTAYPDRLVESPLKDKQIKTIIDLRNVLELQGGAEVEVRFLDKKGNSAYWIDGEKTNHLIWDYIKTNYPKTHLTVESSSSMIEFDTGLCPDYESLLQQLEIINTIKKDICKTFNLKEGPARVTSKELAQDFVNPIHPLLMERISDYKTVTAALEGLRNITDKEKVSYGLDKTNIDRIPYYLSIETTLPPDIMKLTQTTSQQLTVSSKSFDHPFSKTLWIYAQTLNYLAELHKLTGSYRPRTDIRGLQFGQVVEFRSANNIGVGGGYDPDFPGIKYPEHMKKKHFPNKTKDGYTIGNMDNFIMSQGPKSLKFAVNEQGDIIPRSEFRLQDSMKDTLQAQKNIDKMFLDFINSPYANLPMRIYEKN